MRWWPWGKPLSVEVPPLPVPDGDEERRAEERRHIEAARARQSRVDAVVQDDEERRKRNNFGPTIARALGAPPR